MAEKAVQELGREFLNVAPEGGPVSNAQATARLNSRIRSSGLSAKDQLTGSQLPFSDSHFIQHQCKIRNNNHRSSAI